MGMHACGRRSCHGKHINVKASGTPIKLSAELRLLRLDVVQPQQQPHILCHSLRSLYALNGNLFRELSSLGKCSGADLDLIILKLWRESREKGQSNLETSLAAAAPASLV